MANLNIILVIDFVSFDTVDQNSILLFNYKNDFIAFIYNKTHAYTLMRV